ncbi:2206_t:CDS:2, partial [Cetraspora pellucida]
QPVPQGLPKQGTSHLLSDMQATPLGQHPLPSEHAIYPVGQVALAIKAEEKLLKATAMRINIKVRFFIMALEVFEQFKTTNICIQ